MADERSVREVLISELPKVFSGCFIVSESGTALVRKSPEADHFSLYANQRAVPITHSTDAFIPALLILAGCSVLHVLTASGSPEIAEAIVQSISVAVIGFLALLPASDQVVHEDHIFSAPRKAHHGVKRFAISCFPRTPVESIEQAEDARVDDCILSLCQGDITAPLPTNLKSESNGRWPTRSYATLLAHPASFQLPTSTLRTFVVMVGVFAYGVVRRGYQLVSFRYLLDSLPNRRNIHRVAIITLGGVHGH